MSGKWESWKIVLAVTVNWYSGSVLIWILALCVLLALGTSILPHEESWGFIAVSQCSVPFFIENVSIDNGNEYAHVLVGWQPPIAIDSEVFKFFFSGADHADGSVIPALSILINFGSGFRRADFGPRINGFHLDAQPHDRISMNACHSLDRANRRSFRQCGDNYDLLIHVEHVGRDAPQ